LLVTYLCLVLPTD